MPPHRPLSKRMICGSSCRTALHVGSSTRKGLARRGSKEPGIHDARSMTLFRPAMGTDPQRSSGATATTTAWALDETAGRPRKASPRALVAVRC